MKITIIGVGNIGGAIARGLAKGELVRTHNITVSDRSEQKLDELKHEYPEINVRTDNNVAVHGADLVIVAVKPWLMEQVMTELRDALDYDSQSIVSIAAGVTFEMIGSYLKKDTVSGRSLPVMYRVIPNTAIMFGQSVTFIAHNEASAEGLDRVVEIFSDLGLAMVTDERQMIAGTSLASCGIAFALKYIDSSIKGGEELGFTTEQSRDIVIQTVRGALELLDQNGSMPQAEIDKVTTPGGVTLKGLEAMQSADFHKAVIAGLKSSR